MTCLFLCNSVIFPPAGLVPRDSWSYAFISFYLQLCLTVLHANTLVVSVSRDPSQEYSALPQDLFHCKLLDLLKCKILGIGSWICHQVLNQMIHACFNFSSALWCVVSDPVCSVCVMLETDIGRIGSIRQEPPQLNLCIFCCGSAVGVSHSSCVASLLPGAVAGWCLRCLLGGPCPRYSSAWLWVSQSEPFVYADRMSWLLTWKKWPRRVVL